MNCSRCQSENPPQAKFCLECGARLALTCAKCRSELPTGAKFCPECGEPLAAQTGAESRFPSPESYTPKHLAERILTSRAALEGERKQVTVLFCDIVESTRLAERLDPEAMHDLMDRTLRLMAEAVHRYEGTVIAIAPTRPTPQKFQAPTRNLSTPQVEFPDGEAKPPLAPVTCARPKLA